MPYCNICGKPTSCSNKTGWRNFACSIEHWKEWVQQESGEPKMAYKLRASMDGLVYDITDYVVKGEDVELKTSMLDKVINLSDTEYLVVLDAEKKNLLKTFEDDGEFVQVDKSEYEDIIKYNVSPATPSAVTNEDDVSRKDVYQKGQKKNKN